MTGDQQPIYSSKKLTERLDVDFALLAAGLGVWEVNPVSNQVIWDDRCRELFGLAQDNQLPYQQAVQYIHPEDRERVDQAVKTALDPRSDGVYDQTYRTLGADDGILRWVRFYGRTYFTPTQEVSRFAGVAQDVTQTILDRQAIETSQRQVLDSFEKTPVGIAVLGRQHLTFQMANPFFSHLVGRLPDQLITKPLLEALPELAGQGFDDLLGEVFKTGVPFSAPEVAVAITRNNQRETIYVDLTFQPQYEPDKRISGILIVAIDATQQVLTRQKIEESERFARTIFYNSPVAKLVYTGEEMILHEANEKMLTMFERDASIIGQPIMETIPEFRRTQLKEKYRRVLATGETLEEVAEPIELIKQGQSYWGYYDYTYKPLFDGTGKAYGVMCTAIEVTQQVRDRQKLVEAEASLRGAVELAQLGTWSIDVATQGLIFSDRMIEWFGYDPKAYEYREVIPILDEGDQERVNRAVAWALNPESDGVYNEIYTVIHLKTGHRRILHARGKTVFDAKGKAVRLNGTAQDITLQRNLQLTLESEVELRTQELAALNEELAASNEEYAAINEEYVAVNEELEEANQLLHRSNKNLQEFAYIASHDLQEPLRKIQQFGDLLHSQYGTQVGEGLSYLERMQGAASRMSRLIKDLLSYSRLGMEPSAFVAVSLSRVLDTVLGDLELRIEETRAQVQMGDLPTVSGDASQLGQLFLNLVGNALKFRQPGTAQPLIQIRSAPVAATDLPAGVKAGRGVEAYHRIEVIDNGIGFEAKYADQIFQVFQRLHGKNQYAGTGIGLAVCQKVVTNHGGAITASSAPGQGSTFSVYLPL